MEVARAAEVIGGATPLGGGGPKVWRASASGFLVHTANGGKMSAPDVKAYAGLLREVAREVAIGGGPALADAAGLGRDARRRAKSHWLGKARPARADHAAYVAALRRAIRDKYSFMDGEFWRLNNVLTEVEAMWPFLARLALRPDCVSTDDRPNVVPWPAFASGWMNGEFHDEKPLRIGVDFSGSQSVEMAWVIPLKPVRSTRGHHLESLIVVKRDGRPRLAWRIEYAPRAQRGAPPETWSLYHDETLWREPAGRVIAIEPGVVVPADPELKVLYIETFERGTLPVLFVCTH